MPTPLCDLNLCSYAACPVPGLDIVNPDFSNPDPATFDHEIRTPDPASWSKLQLFFPVPMLSLRLLQTSRRIPWTLVKLQCSSKSQPNMAKPVELSIRSKLTQNLAPVHLEVHNESSMHAVPKGSETHFKVVVISETFDGKSLIQRHRLVNEVLKAELDGPVHALSIQAKTPQQWEENPSISPSPACMGGSKHDPAMSKKLNSQV
ncbi:bolA-like protein 1 [Ascaphus truei]|uniref:bolA-like protein 1 n=1 Tax=Ascaphus truei TaxID=8439 RepID=UPI003F5A2726